MKMSTKVMLGLAAAVVGGSAAAVVINKRCERKSYLEKASSILEELNDMESSNIAMTPEVGEGKSGLSLDGMWKVFVSGIRRKDVIRCDIAPFYKNVWDSQPAKGYHLVKVGSEDGVLHISNQCATVVWKEGCVFKGMSTDSSRWSGFSISFKEKKPFALTDKNVINFINGR